MKINDHVYIKDKSGKVNKNNPNCMGRVTGIDMNHVYITNMNMPFMGTYAHERIPKEWIVEQGDE